MLSFDLSGPEHDRATAFHDKHRRRHGKRGGRPMHYSMSYEFTPTGIGIKVIVRCSCGEWSDVTEYESW
jgi:hypothetical protein